MTQPGNTDPPPSEAPKAGVPGADVRHLGHLGVDAVEPDHARVPQIDIVVAATGPAYYAPAVAKPYLGTAKRGPNILQNQDGPDEGHEAAEYAQSIFPGSEFSYLGNGRYGVVLADTTGKAFKVYRSASEAYSRYEKEAAALQVLSEAGLAPKLWLFVDANPAYRLDRKAHDYTAFGFEDVQIPRQDSGRELPIMVMDKVAAEPLETAQPAKLIDGFCKATELFLREHIVSWDAEVMVDRSTGDLVMLDVGELSQLPFDAASATPQAKLDHDSRILSNLAHDFGLPLSDRHITSAYQQGGLEAVRELLTKYY